MKLYTRYQIVGFIFILLLILASCETEQDIKGSGVVVTKRYSVAEFSDLKIDGILNIYFKQEDTYRVEVKTDDNLQSIMRIESEGGTLKIYKDSNDDFEATEMDIYVSAPQVENILLDGVTALYVNEPIQQDNITIEKQNTGYMYMHAQLNRFTLYTDGVGDVALVGKSQNAVINNSMIGNIQAYKFAVDNMILSHCGTGTIELQVLSELEVELEGVGDVYCKGNPTQISKYGTGLGKLYMVE